MSLKKNIIFLKALDSNTTNNVKDIFIIPTGKKKKKKKAPVLTLNLDGLLKTCEIKYTWGSFHPPDKPGLNLHFEQGQKDLKTFETGKKKFYEL